MEFHICWSVDCESCRPEINDTALGRRAIEGFCELLENVGWKGTLFLMPEEISHMPDLLLAKAQAGHEIAMHLHPDQSGYPHAQMGRYSYDEQVEILGKALEAFERILGIRPVSVRNGYASSNDATFAAFAAMGFKQSSTTLPGRKMSQIASNWGGAPLFAHYANPYNRFLEGGLDLVEIPVSVDWETMIWGGIHPQDLRVELMDAKNHGFAIRKIMERLALEDLPLRALIPSTHNIFEYSDKTNFRRQTMEGMIDEIIRHSERLGVSRVGSTIADAASSYRTASPAILSQEQA